MYKEVTLCLLTLPIELIYRILDNLDELTILLSMRNVCTRLNAITDTYHRYQVMLSCFLSHIFIIFKLKNSLIKFLNIRSNSSNKLKIYIDLHNTESGTGKFERTEITIYH